MSEQLAPNYTTFPVSIEEHLYERLVKVVDYIAEGMDTADHWSLDSAITSALSDWVRNQEKRMEADARGDSDYEWDRQ